MGNTISGDGWAFRGSGPLQATGRAEITNFMKFYNAKFGTSLSISEIATMMRDKENIEMGMHFACWFFSMAKGLIPMAIADDFRGIVKKINGGYNGLDERTKYYERCKKYLS